MTLPHVLDQVDAKLAEWRAAQGLPAYRAAQARRWLFERRAADWDGMTDLPKTVRTELATQFRLWTTQVARHTQAEDGTEKLLFGLADGGQVECVLLRGGERRTICISTQVGCGMGCVFCASGLDGVDRNLTTGEIVEQMLRLQRLLNPSEPGCPAHGASGDNRLSHIVVMGMGEPLANLDRLLPALDEARREDGLGISARRITISTVGLPPAMDRLARHPVHYRLAVSLHAPNDALRNQLVPVNKNIGLRAVLDAADRYFAASGRQLTFEYVLLADVNDAAEHAHELAALLSGREALLNVIPYNPVAGLPYRTPTPERRETFRTILEQAGVRVKFRHRKGDRIDAACGQLRRSQQIVTLQD
ncbi:MAG TPA: 23S rRNA (adenine(2503)-C(2))-methyltransferase RlmN [Lacipirellulaceae bacterium]|nr:23S rRNA (adenine(2503)-C(2))-methyltransferase RlmN [Lacipirellulaceae bacterium]